MRHLLQRATRPMIASACSKSCCRSAIRSVPSCRSPCRETIEHVLTVAQRTASWQQPARQVLIASGAAKGDFVRRLRRGCPGARDDHDSRRRANISALSRTPPRAVSSSNTLGIPRGDKMAYAKQALRTTISSARMWRSSTPTSRSVTARSIAAPMSAISCWRLKRSVSAPSRAALARHSGLIRRLQARRRSPRGLRHLVRLADHAHKVNSSDLRAASRYRYFRR